MTTNSLTSIVMNQKSICIASIWTKRAKQLCTIKCHFPKSKSYCMIIVALSYNPDLRHYPQRFRRLIIMSYHLSKLSISKTWQTALALLLLLLLLLLRLLNLHIHLLNPDVDVLLYQRLLMLSRSLKSLCRTRNCRGTPFQWGDFWSRTSQTSFDLLLSLSQTQRSVVTTEISTLVEKISRRWTYFPSWGEVFIQVFWIDEVWEMMHLTLLFGRMSDCGCI